MRLQSECIKCQVVVRYRDILRVTGDEEVRVMLLSNVIRILSEEVLRGNRIMPLVATKLFRYIKRASGVEDPYADEKIKADLMCLRALEVLRDVLDDVSDDLERLRFCIRCALVGNSIDVGVSSYEQLDVNAIVSSIGTMNVYGIDDIDIVRGKRILYLLDNSGEAALDKLLAEELRRHDNEVIAVVKSRPFQNDVTISEADVLKLRESFDDVIETGTDAASIVLDEISDDLREELRSCDLIISKGMAHYEYLTEIKIEKTAIYMLKAKCRPVASSLGVPLNSYVVKVQRSA